MPKLPTLVDTLHELWKPVERVERIGGASHPFNPLPELASAAESVDSNPCFLWAANDCKQKTPAFC